MARWIRRQDRTGRVLVAANQQPGLLARYGISREEADRAAWAIDLTGRRFEGAAAVNRVLEELGGCWPAAARAYRFGPVAALEDAAYRRFARNRHRLGRFGVRPECDEPVSRCS